MLNVIPLDFTFSIAFQAHFSVFLFFIFMIILFIIFPCNKHMYETLLDKRKNGRKRKMAIMETGESW